MSITPPQQVVNATLAATSRIIRRVEIYEADGETRWNADKEIRLVDGSVNIDYSRDERRTLDITLDNSDGRLVNAPKYFWYDKIIKVFRGVNVGEQPRPPKVLIISDDNTVAPQFRKMLASVGIGTVTVNTEVATIDGLAGYEVIVSLGSQATPLKTALLQEAYGAGMRVFTQGQAATEMEIPFITASASVTAADFTGNPPWNITPNAAVTEPLVTGWHAEDYTPPILDGVVPTALAADAIAISPTAVANQSGSTLIAAVNASGGRWVHMQPMLADTSNTANFLARAFDWLNPFVPLADWETQIGEFMIDKISEDHFPHLVKVTGRDYTKKCLNSKFEQATQFNGGQQLETLVGAISANAGIYKKVLPVTGITVGKSFMYERGTERWKAIVEIANAYNYDVYFDGQGYLRMTVIEDPATTQSSMTFRTGPLVGNLSTYSKSTNDSRIYNHVLVTGDPGDGSTLPPSAEAKNTDPNSPTNIDQIGDRLYQYASSFIATTEQAQAVADSFLAVHALEEFQLDLTGVVLFWMDVGEIVTWIDPSPAPGDPTRFLLSNITIPLTLGPMSATALRVTNVGT